MAKTVRWRQSNEVHGEFVFSEEVLWEVCQELRRPDPEVSHRKCLWERIFPYLLYPVAWLFGGWRMSRERLHDSVFQDDRRVRDAFARNAIDRMERFSEWVASQEGEEVVVVGANEHALPESPPGDASVSFVRVDLADLVYLNIIEPGRYESIQCFECGKEFPKVEEKDEGYNHGPLAAAVKPTYRCPAGHLLFQTVTLVS